MKHLFVFFTISILFLMLGSCAEQMDRDASVYTIDLDQIARQECQFNMQIENCILLETTTQSLVKPSDKIVFANHTIYVSDREKMIHLFADSGKYLSSISRRGRGPGEYLSLTDFDVDADGNIYVLCAHGKKIIKYFSPDYSKFDVTAVHNQAMELCLKKEAVWMANVFESDHLLGLGLLNEEGVIAPSIEIRDDFDKLTNELIQVKKKSFYPSDEGLLFNQRFSRDVYELKESEKQLLCTINSSLPVLQDRKGENDLRGFESIYRSGDLLLGHLCQSGKFYPLFLISDLSTGISSLCNPLDIGLPVFSGTFTMKGDHFIAILNPLLLMRSERIEAKNILNRMDHTISCDDNPILVEFTLTPKI